MYFVRRMFSFLGVDPDVWWLQQLIGLTLVLQPMKVQQDSFEERSASPDLPEPLYEEVGDFGLQVLKSLETSFLSSSSAETQEVRDQLQLTLVPMETGVLEHPKVCEPQTEDGSAEAVEQRGGEGEGVESARMRQLQGVCSPSQELLLQELSHAFIKKPEEAQQEQEAACDL